MTPRDACLKGGGVCGSTVAGAQAAKHRHSYQSAAKDCSGRCQGRLHSDGVRERWEPGGQGWSVAVVVVSHSKSS